MPAHPQVPPQCPGETQRALAILALMGRADCDAQVVELAIETKHPGRLLGAVHLGSGLLGAHDEECAMFVTRSL
jgi:hypothetical protein